MLIDENGYEVTADGLEPWQQQYYIEGERVLTLYHKGEMIKENGRWIKRNRKEKLDLFLKLCDIFFNNFSLMRNFYIKFKIL